MNDQYIFLNYLSTSVSLLLCLGLLAVVFLNYSFFSFEELFEECCDFFLFFYIFAKEVVICNLVYYNIFRLIFLSNYFTLKYVLLGLFLIFT